MANSKYKRVKRADDPRRCKATTGKSQCMYESSVEGGDYCPLHSANSRSTKAAETASLNQYRLAKYQARIAELAVNPKVKSLRDEIAILRMTLESILEVSHDHNALYMNSTKISDMAVKIEKLVTSCHNLEVKSGLLLDKNAVVNLAEQLVQVVTAHVEDPDTLLAVSEGIQKVILDNISTE